jgi:anti-anti-sigma factor
MTSIPELTYTWDTPSVHIGRLVLAGSVVYANADELLQAVTDRLAAQGGLRELHIDCAGLDICDSMGLSTLLMLRRRTESLGLDLRLLNRPSPLDRMLERTGTYDYLTGPTEARREDREPTGG